MAKIDCISAVTLAITNMQASIRFYEAAGFECLKGGASASFTTLKAGNQYLNLSAEATTSPGFWGRAIFHVDDVDDMYRYCCAQGLSPEFAPADAPWGERYFHLVDPDGHEISFARPLKASADREAR